MENKNLQFNTFIIDNIEYLVIDKIKLDNTTYYYLSNKDNNQEMMLRKITNDEPNILKPLDNNSEVIKIANLLNKK